MNCAEYTKLASASQDARLPRRDRLRMFMHHIICVYCRRFANQLAVIRRQLQKHPGDAQMPTEMRNTIARNIGDDHR